MSLDINHDIYVAMLNSMVAEIGVTTGAYLEMRGGVRPATVSDPATGVQIAIAPLPIPVGTVAASPTGATLTFTLPLAPVRITADEVTWARLYDGNLRALIDFTVTLTGGGGDIEVDQVVGVVGSSMNFTGAYIAF